MENINLIKKNILIGFTGSVATIRILQIIEIFKEKFNIKIILTQKSKIFSDELIEDYSIYEKENNVKFYNDEDEYAEWKENKKVLHIELRKWADLVLLSPLSANTLAKITNGISDNLLTCVIRAWDFSKPGFFALAMNTFMYEHFLTQKQTKILTDEFKFIEIPSVSKKLVCGDIGQGGIADTIDIYNTVIKYFEQKI